MHFNDVHEPYQERSPWYEEQGNQLDNQVAAYDSEISFLDSVLETLYRDLSWDRNTLLVVVSDHGEEFMEHGRVGHQLSLYDELTRVVIGFFGSDLALPPRLDDSVNISLIDVVPTILDFIGLDQPPGVDGRSLLPFLQHEQASEATYRRFAKRPLLAHRSHHRARQGLPERHIWSVILGPWKLIEFPSGPKLFNLEDDPEETIDVRMENQGAVDYLEGILDKAQAEEFRSTDTEQVEIDEATLENLKSLGYVQ